MKQVLIIMMTLFIGFHNPMEEKFQRVITGKITGADDGLPLPQVTVLLKGTTLGTTTNKDGKFSIRVPDTGSVLVFRFLGYITQEIKVGQSNTLNVMLAPDAVSLAEVVVTGVQSNSRRSRRRSNSLAQANVEYEVDMASMPSPAYKKSVYFDSYRPSNESYKKIDENGFKSPWKNPYSTLSIDVDAASYSNVRRFINAGQLPPKDAVKIEEMINYFNYDYESPKGKHPFGVEHEVSLAPWNEDHKLVHVGIQGEKIEMDNLPASNIVFLIDVSGSMGNHNKLPLLKKSFKLLINELRRKDRVAMVVYAGAAGEVLESTPGNEKKKILKALDKLNAGGSTAGGAGIQLAYKIAKENFIEGGNNRVILATDGDFNVGASSDDDMESLIENQRKSGVFLTVLGYGMGNYKDSKMEVLADKGNGNHAYIDNILEAKKVLVKEFGGTLFTIAKDVKIQVEFNPATVQAYRLIGYENRRLNDEDFNNDKKDAGELGSGHSVAALYEVIPVGVESNFKPLDDLKYRQKKKIELSGNESDLMTVKLRYKKPDEDKSIYLDTVVKNDVMKIGKTSNNFRWSAAVAGFGMLLRDSDYSNGLKFDAVIRLAKAAKGEDEEGYRAELIKLVEMAELLGEGE
ncbi:VWA domain-containing protein [Roseivirga sp. E12]|uniref:vWA domain-containing protein n=1 Tax=Roseivirga sp. E12 TaxID=2819237 RepID=UPI001ABC7159|nr:VWA domain-containing protein [Roseivirga sp. E12]MBO3700546.1 von Willebrand factor type A domain-containing protein [Roseivirga sp. E12]